MTRPASPADARLFDALGRRAKRLSRGDPVAPPITPASQFVLPGAPDGADAYGRQDQPSWREVEDVLSALEDAETVSFPSGMAACAAVLQTRLRPGDRVVLPADGYYVVRRLASEILAPMGVVCSTTPTAGYDEAAFDGAALVWIETPSNPALQACDIARIAARAHAAGALVVADNTMATPLLQRPLDLGVDLVVSSDTKAMAGHSDVLFGHVAGRDAALMDPVRAWRTVVGAIPGPFECFLVHRGLQTLGVRLPRMCANAAAVANALRGRPGVEALRYPGLPDDPAHDICARQMDDFGFVLSLTLADEATAEAFIAASRAIVPATSFGGVHTSGERRARWGDDVPPGFVRLSAGCEPTDALTADLVQALDAAAR